MSFLLGVLLLAIGDAPTDSANSPPQTVQVPAQQPAVGAPKTNNVERKICRREESPESRIGGKQICLTAEQWRKVQREQ